MIQICLDFRATERFITNLFLTLEPSRRCGGQSQSVDQLPSAAVFGINQMSSRFMGVHDYNTK